MATRKQSTIGVDYKTALGDNGGVKRKAETIGMDYSSALGQITAPATVNTGGVRFQQSIQPAYEQLTASKPTAIENFFTPALDITKESIARIEARNALQGMNSRKAAHQKDMQQQKTNRLEDELKLKQQQAAAFSRAGNPQLAKQAREEAAQLEQELSGLNHVSALQEGADFERRQYYEMMDIGGTPLVEEFTKHYIQLRDNADKASATNPGFAENNGAWQAAKDEYNQWYSDMVSRYGEETVDRWMEYGQRIHDQKATEQYNRTLSEAAKADKFGTSVLSVPLNLTSGLGYLDVVGQKAENLLTGKDYPINYNTQAQRNAQAASNIRGAVSEDMSGVGSFLYNTGMSMLDSATMLATGNVGAVLLGGAAATNSMHDAVQRGASTNEALAIGLIAGVAESAMEKASIDKLFGQKNAESVKDIVWNVLKQAGAEGTEEGLTNLVNTIADGIIMGDKSQINTMIRNYMAMGYSEEQASGMAIAEWAKGLGLDILGGAISGGIMGGGKSLFDYAANSAGRGTTGSNTAAAEAINTPTETGEIETNEDGKPEESVVLFPTEEQKKATLETELEGLFVDEPIAIGSKNANQSSALSVQNTMDSDIAAAMADMKTPEQRIAEDLGGMSNPMENKTAPAVEPKRVGRVTILQDPYTGETPVYTRPENKKNPSVNAELVSGADLSIKYAHSQSSNNIKGFTSTLRGTWEKIFKNTGESGRKVRVDGLSFLGKPYDVSLHKTLVGKIVSDGEATAEKLAVINIIDDVVKNGEYVGSTNYTPKNNKIKDTVRFDHFETPVYIETEIDGKIVPKEYIVKFEVEVFPSEKNYRFHRVVNEMDLVPSHLTDTGRNLPQGDRTQDPSNNSISNSISSVNPENVGDMGAKTSQFRNEVRESQSKTTPYYYEKNNVPDEGRADNHYTMVHRDESLHNAQLRLEQDYVGEVEELRGKPTWTDEEMLEADLILRDLRKDAEQSGDWSKHREWAKIFGEHKSEAGRSLAILSMLNKETGDAILEKAAVFLEQADKGTDVNAVMQTISELTTQYDMATAERNVDALISIIKDSAKTRKTGFMGGKLSNITSKPLEWALNRLANYAKTDPMAGTKQVNPQQFKVGDVVKAKDRGNYGHVVKDNGDGTYEVHFKAKTGQTATKTFDATQLQSYRKSGVTAGDISSDPSSSAYSFLKALAASSIESIASDTNRASVVDMAKTVRRNGMLSKVSTIFRNLVGNVTFDLVDTIARDISVPLDMLLSKFTGTRSVAVDLSYISDAKRQGMLDGLAMAMLETSLDINARDQQSKYETSSGRTFKMSGNVVSKVLSTWEAAMGYGLYVTDEINKGGTSAEIQRGLNKLYKQGKIKDDSLRDGGQQEALYRTFQDDSALATATQKIKDATGIVGEIELPFAKVPANLADRAVDYSPAGAAKSIYKIGKALYKAKKGEFTAANQAALVQSIGRNITGTTLIGAALYFAAKGIIRVQNPGEKEEDKNKAADEKASGLTGTQINLSALLRDEKGESSGWRDGDTLMSISFLEPFNAQLTIGALLAEDIENEAGLRTILGHSLSGVLEAVADMPVFEAINNTSNSIKYSKADTKGGRIIDGVAQSLGTNLVSGFIPNAVKGIAQGLDPYQRDLYSGDTFGERVGDQFRGVFNRNALLIKQDVYGNDLKNEDMFLNFMNSNILPGAITKYKETDLQKELRSLEETIGSTSGYLSSNAPESVSIDGKTVKLTDDQKQDYMSVRGDAYEFASDALQNSDMFQNFSSALKKKAYEYAEDYANQTAKETLGIDYKPSGIAADLTNPTSKEFLDAVLQSTIDSFASNKKLYANKYKGLAEMREDNTIDDQIALALMSNSYRSAYIENLQGNGVPVQTWLDILNAANRQQGGSASNKSTKAKRNDAYAYIDRLNLTVEQKKAAEAAIGQAFPYTIVQNAKRK